MSEEKKLRIAAAKLIEICKNIFQKAGTPPDTSKILAGSLVKAEMRGITSHGLRNVETYLNRVLAGGIDAKAWPEIKQAAGGIAWLDGKAGFGQLLAEEACRKGMELAGELGTGFVLGGNANHAGALGIYTSQVAKKGYICFMCSNANPTVAAPGGKEAVLGTNPLAFSFPSPRDFGPITVDLATSAVAKGKIYNMPETQNTIPSGWALDKEGNPTTDTKAALKGILLPMGGPKGYSLAVAVEMLSGILDGVNFTSDLSSLHREADRPQGVSLSLFMIKVDFIKPLDSYLKDVDEFCRRLKSSKKEKNQQIYLPGEIEQMREKECLEKGVEVSESLYQWLLSRA